MQIGEFWDYVERAARAGEGEAVAKILRDFHPLDLMNERKLRLRRGAILMLARFSENRQRELSGARAAPALEDVVALSARLLPLIDEARHLDNSMPDVTIAQSVAAIEQALSSRSDKSASFFISYRREDTGESVARLTDRLVAAFGDGAVFRDIDSIPIGSDFRAHLVAAVSRAAICLVVIGPDWLDARASRGGRRLDEPGDWVRVEIETALRLNRGLVPILIGGAAMPAAEDLPACIADLSFREGQNLRADPEFHGDTERLITRLRARLDQPR